ncbi:MAG: hypothetical protein ACXVKA_02050 [Acidimicrobiia bacterium]
MKRALVGAAMLLLSSACGGSSGMTKADYVKQANAICRDAAKQVAALEAPSSADVASLPKAAASVVQVQRRTLDRLRAIHPPKAGREQITEWIALVDQTIDQAEVSARSQRDGDLQRAVTANVNGAALDRRADQLAKSYGLTMCVQAASAPTTTTTSTKPKT